MDHDNDIPAEGELNVQGAPQVGGEDLQQQGSGVPAGFQRRIDQLVARNHASEAQIAALSAQLAEMGARVAVGGPQGAPAADPYAELDPTLASAFRAVSKNMEDRVAQIAAKFDAVTQGQSAGQIANSRGLPAELAKRAAQLAEAWRANGLEKFKPEDAVTFAVGEAVAAGTYNPQGRSRDVQGKFAPTQPAIGAQGALPDLRPQQKPLPTNFESMSPEEQLRLLDERGVGDIPL